ncbi:hypothetical protein SAMN04487905_102205 [Actinopolyspora xinjiangensis]|uniref:Uncharacterized protein n=1 Tax=Actinopolyspora xinjiangensis TaxID=405564 RepID=A0A1H0QGM0_9ACTN|nr:hypothetical protein SAMN04487905_102205 [Actinopolyspora xinjiangensis]
MQVCRPSGSHDLPGKKSDQRPHEDAWSSLFRLVHAPLEVAREIAAALSEVERVFRRESRVRRGPDSGATPRRCNQRRVARVPVEQRAVPSSGAPWSTPFASRGRSPWGGRTANGTRGCRAAWNTSSAVRRDRYAAAPNAPQVPRLRDALLHLSGQERPNRLFPRPNGWWGAATNSPLRPVARRTPRAPPGERPARKSPGQERERGLPGTGPRRPRVVVSRVNSARQRTAFSASTMPAP